MAGSGPRKSQRVVCSIQRLGKGDVGGDKALMSPWGSRKENYQVRKKDRGGRKGQNGWGKRAWGGLTITRVGKMLLAAALLHLMRESGRYRKKKGQEVKWR